MAARASQLSLIDLLTAAALQLEDLPLLEPEKYTSNAV